MVQPCRVWWLVLTAAALLIGSPSFAHEATEVDLALVLAVDVSSSMDSDEQDLQRQGYVNALRSAMVLGAIRSGRTGRIAVIYVDWSDAFDQRIVVPWTVIGDHEQATIFARALEEKATRMARGIVAAVADKDAAHELDIISGFTCLSGTIGLSSHLTFFFRITRACFQKRLLSVCSISRPVSSLSSGSSPRCSCSACSRRSW